MKKKKKNLVFKKNEKKNKKMKYFLQFKVWTVDVSALTRIRQVCARWGTYQPINSL